MEEVVVEIEKQKALLDSITNLMFKTVEMVTGSSEDEVAQSLRPLFQKAMTRSEDDIRRTLVISPPPNAEDVLLVHMSTNRALLQGIEELQLRILSQQTGRSVLDLRNEYL